MFEKVFFRQEEEVREKIDALFRAQVLFLGALLPSAELHHVGSTSIPGSLTKGDLDIQIRVRAEDFAEAERLLAKNYQRNEGNEVTEDYASFKNEGLDLGIQLSAIGGKCDFFLAFRNLLIARKDLRLAYDALKKGFHGKSMDEYRAAKAAFIEPLLS